VGRQLLGGKMGEDIQNGRVRLDADTEKALMTGQKRLHELMTLMK
jgi:hypothetical protein